MPALDIGSLASNVELALFPVASKWLTSLSDYKPFGNLSSNYPFVPLPKFLSLTHQSPKKPAPLFGKSWSF